MCIGSCPFLSCAHTTFSGDDAQTMDCQVECARLMSSIAGRDAATLLAGGALRAVEGMLERLAGKHRSASSPTPPSSTWDSQLAFVQSGSSKGPDDDHGHDDNDDHGNKCGNRSAATTNTTADISDVLKKKFTAGPKHSGGRGGARPVAGAPKARVRPFPIWGIVQGARFSVKLSKW